MKYLVPSGCHQLTASLYRCRAFWHQQLHVAQHLHCISSCMSIITFLAAEEYERIELRHLDHAPTDRRYQGRHLHALPGVPKCVYAGFDMRYLIPTIVTILYNLCSVVLYLGTNRNMCISMLSGLALSFIRDVVFCVLLHRSMKALSTRRPSGSTMYVSEVVSSYTLVCVTWSCLSRRQYRTCST